MRRKKEKRKKLVRGKQTLLISLESIAKRIENGEERNEIAVLAADDDSWPKKIERKKYERKGGERTTEYSSSVSASRRGSLGIDNNKRRACRRS